MTATLDLIAAQALSLPEDERMSLARQLLESRNKAAGAEMETAWYEEAARRMAAYDAGEMDAIPSEEVFAAMRARANPS